MLAQSLRAGGSNPAFAQCLGTFSPCCMSLNWHERVPCGRLAFLLSGRNPAPHPVPLSLLGRSACALSWTVFISHIACAPACICVHLWVCVCLRGCAHLPDPICSFDPFRHQARCSGVDHTPPPPHTLGPASMQLSQLYSSCHIHSPLSSPGTSVAFNVLWGLRCARPARHHGGLVAARGTALMSSPCSTDLTRR